MIHFRLLSNRSTKLWCWATNDCRGSFLVLGLIPKVSFHSSSDLSITSQGAAEKLSIILLSQDLVFSSAQKPEYFLEVLSRYEFRERVTPKVRNFFCVY